MARISRKQLVALALILAAAAGVRFARLGVPPELYFDEVYHGFTAHGMVHGGQEARDTYDPWAKNPPGKANEWTHPPLGKLIIAGTMRIFGESFAAMRASSAAFGTLAVFLTFWLGMVLFGDPRASLLAAGFVCVEGLAFAHSRIAVPDVHLLCFSLLALILYALWRREKSQASLLVACGLFLGLALSTKWTALYLIAFLGINLLLDWFRDERRRGFGAVALWFASLGLLPALVYFVSYSHYFRLGYTFDQFLALQKQMWWYHTGLKATHPYQSRPWQWLLNIRPVWFYVNYRPDGRLANIYNLGNHVVLYGGLASIAWLALGLRKKFDWARAFLVSAYFVFWLPWLFSPRIMLFYHYLPAVPLLSLALGLAVSGWLSSGDPRRERAAHLTVALSIAWFALFYPHLAAVPLPKWFVEHVYFLAAPR